MKKQLIAFALVFASLSGCAATQESVNSEEMYVHASALTKLSIAVEAMVRYQNPSPSWTDEELLAAATEHDSALLGNLSGYKLRVLSEDRHAIVLMCSSSGEIALLEDAGCTGRLDSHRWQEPSPCEFSLVVDDLCNTPAD